jgi:hypothetical protein
MAIFAYIYLHDLVLNMVKIEKNGNYESNQPHIRDMVHIPFFYEKGKYGIVLKF